MVFLMGQAAGAAVALSARRGVIPRDLDVEELQRVLHEDYGVAFGDGAGRRGGDPHPDPLPPALCAAGEGAERPAGVLVGHWRGGEDASCPGRHGETGMGDKLECGRTQELARRAGAGRAGATQLGQTC